MDPIQPKEKNPLVSTWALGQTSFLNPWTLPVVFVLLGLAVIIGILALVDTSESTAERIARTGVIRIGYAVEAPFAYEDNQGRVTGESPEVARAVWQRLGVQRIEWIRTDFASLIPQLCTGRFDQIACGLFIREDRQRLVDFSSPSLCLTPALLVRRGNPLNVHSYRDIALHEGVRLAVLNGSAEMGEAVRAGIPAERVVTYPNVPLALQALRTGLVDGLSLSAPTIRHLAATNGDLQRALPFEAAYTSTGCSAFAFRKSDGQLNKQFEQALRAFLGSHEHLQILLPLGLDEGDLPAQIPLLQRENDS